jgi:hypothetical protein
MFGIFTNLTKAALNVAVTPLAVAKDIVSLPVTAYEDKNPFESTSKVLDNVSKSLNKALDPDE